MKNKLAKLSLVMVAAVFLVASCKKTLDINQDPNRPTTVAPNRLLPSAINGVGYGLAMGYGLSQVLSVYTHQQSTREEPDQYGATGSEFYLQQGWTALYQSGLANLEQIIKDGEASGNLRYAGIAKVLKAYTFSQLVDVFGDVPFSEALKLQEGIRSPKFDDDAAIYPQLIAMLDDGIADLKDADAPNVLVPGTDDLIYNGSAAKWIKAANTIKLKLYTQLRKVQNVGPEVTALLAAPADLINATNESFLVPFGPNAAFDDRHPGFGDYYATQRSNHVSPWMYEIMKGYNTGIFTGTTDPRIPYYIYNQLKATQAPREGNQTEYRDGPFVSIYFGSVGPDRDRSQQGTISVFGIYPVGGRYDDGGGLNVNATHGTGAAPQRMITYADRLYLEAELINAGLAPGNERTVLENAMKESFKQIDYVITTYVKPSQTVPTIYNTAASSPMMMYITEVLQQFDAASAQKKLEIIMTQKWLSNIGNAVDQYTDYRRTGYPVMFDPTNPAHAPGGMVQPPLNGDPMNPGAQKPVPVVLSRTYPASLPWHSEELNRNQNAPSQKNPQTYKVFWMP